MSFLSNRVYFLLFSLLAIVYICGLFVPLMDNDSAHHAGIALHMYLTGDYITLVDQNGPYLDKPHLLFWLVAFSYKIFGVTAFAYKFPSFLFTILCVYSVYRLARQLYNRETGKLASLLLATAFAFILANNDVRMDAILVSCIAFATWQLIAFVDTRKLIYILGAAFGLALGFSTKGHIAIIAPVMVVFFYILYKKDWSVLYNWHWLLLILLFALFISPIVYSYYLQYNLHPDVVVRGKDHINGVKFILWDQSLERYGGTMGHRGKNDYFFFLHSFLWAFAPWSILAYIALFKRIRSFTSRKLEWSTTGGFITILLLISFSGFKLPHYVNILFPIAAIMTASFLLSSSLTEKTIKQLYIVQLIVCVLLLLIVLLLNVWAFPVRNAGLIISTIALPVFLIAFIKTQSFSTLHKTVVLPATVMIFSFFLMNTNFYPQLLTYQGGNMLASYTKGKIDPADVYFWEDHYSPSFLFTTASLRKQFADSVLQTRKNVWVLADESKLDEIRSKGYQLGKAYSCLDYSVTELKLKFVNPATREKTCTHMVLVQVSH